jgi:thioredoxin reductase
MTTAFYDVIIVGGGPAGLSAALILGRSRRKVIVLDAGRPRNATSHALHGFITRDGIDPGEFLEIARGQLAQYDTVEMRSAEVSVAVRNGDAFAVTEVNGETFKARKLLLATGVVDELPGIEGLRQLYGKSVFHCPYCDGWEVRDKPLAVYGNGENGLGLALELLLWSRDLVLCSDGPSKLTTDQLARLDQHNVILREEKIERLDGENGRLTQIVFRGGDKLPREAMFFSTGQQPASELAKSLGCQFTEQGCVATGDYEATSVPGVYAAGDASHMAQFVIVAAAEGAQAAVAINKELMKEDLD